MHPVVGPWSISGQNWPLTTDRQIHDPLWWPRPLTAHWPPDTWSTLVTMLMTTIIFVVSGQWSVVRRAKKNWPYNPDIFTSIFRIIIFIFIFIIICIRPVCRTSRTQIETQPWTQQTDQHASQSFRPTFGMVFTCFGKAWRFGNKSSHLMNIHTRTPSIYTNKQYIHANLSSARINSRASRACWHSRSQRLARWRPARQVVTPKFC